MKKNFKTILCTVAVFAATLSLGLFAGCDVKEKINQLKCEHEFGEVVVIEESTCSQKGKGEKTCTKCEKVEEVKLDLADHVAIVVDGVSATCTKTGLTNGTKCSVCEEVIVAQQEIPASGHRVVVDDSVEATCLESGLTAGEHCGREDCGEILKAQEKIPATGHNLVILEAVEPTCTTEGKTQGVWCDKCETIFTEQESIATTDHVDDNGDYACDNCGFVSGTATVVDKSDLSFGRYRIYRQDEAFTFDIIFEYEDEYGGSNAVITPNVPALGVSSPETLDLSVFGISGDVFTIYVYDTYIDIVFKDGEGTYTYQEVAYTINPSVPFDISTLITNFDLYKVS